MSTSGTSGKVLPLYVDLLDIVMGLFAYMRSVHEYGLSIWKHRISVIGDFAPHSAESGYVTRGLQPRFNTAGLLKNIQWLNTNDDPKTVATAINDFQPDFIGGYVGMLGHLAFLKETGYDLNYHLNTSPQPAPSLTRFSNPILNTHFIPKFLKSMEQPNQDLSAFNANKAASISCPT